MPPTKETFAQQTGVPPEQSCGPEQPMTSSGLEQVETQLAEAWPLTIDAQQVWVC
jgi:hypothetical protein